MTEVPLETVVDERLFVGLLQTHAEVFFRLTNSLRGRGKKAWNTKHYYQLIHQANDLESFLDDYGARYNRTYSYLTELVASLRSFALAGYSLSHLAGRLDSYGIRGFLGDTEYTAIQEAVARALSFVRQAVEDMLGAAVAEVADLGMEVTPEEIPEASFLPVVVRQRLPRNVDVEDLPEEKQRIAEVASKYIFACDMLDELGIHPIASAEDRRRFLASACSEEQARVYEATVHNLQSAYDTYVKNTVLETQDKGLPALRGLASSALHLLEAVTFLTHFCERHESDIRSEAAKIRIAQIVDRDAVHGVVLNELLVPSYRLMGLGRSLALDVLKKYTDAQEMVVDLPSEVMLHARPASLIVGVVNHYGTPVELEVGGQRCNAASILELLLAIGTHPDERRFTFRGDAAPLRDIALLFQHGVGERGLDQLPQGLGYLRSR